MDNNTLLRMQGKSVQLTALSLWNDNGKLRMEWEYIHGNCNYRMTFVNVSRINMVDWSYPLQISDLDVICNAENGWDLDSRYHIHDLGDSQISFFCEAYEVTS